MFSAFPKLCSCGRGLLLLLALCQPPPAKSTPACAADRIDRQAVSALVFDGDTLALRDGSRVRLAGINTPELGHESKPSEPLAETAYAHLLRLAGPGRQIRLRFDIERRDRYGRLLAHLFLEDGTNVQAALLSRGLATTLVVPPNEWGSTCYQVLEASARAAGLGVWSLARYQPVPAEDLDSDARGYRIVTGLVQRVGRGHNNLWLNLSPRVAVRIPLIDLGYFKGFQPEQIRGRKVEARGFVQKRKRELRITVRHPAALRLLD